MDKLTDKAAFDSRLKILQDHFSGVVSDAKFQWDSVNAILMLDIRKNWTFESSNSNYQLNSESVKDFFPILQMTNAFPHWRLSMPALISNAVLNNFISGTNDNSWRDGHVSYRHKIQNGVPYLQLTLEEDLRLLKNKLKEHDQIFFLKEQNTAKYFVFATTSKLFSEASILIIDPTKAAEDTTKFELNDIQEKDIAISNSLSPKTPRNKIIYGAPGTGKSYELREQAKKSGFTDENTVRITFHPNYSYQQFVGTYKPTPIYKAGTEGTVFYGSDKRTPLLEIANKEPYIDYSFVQGPLINQLVKALSSPEINYLIIIEEINRAPVSSVFGDIFQLLDRDENGQSEYDIEFNADASNYLRSAGISEQKIRLPKNLFIWATMNSADQGVMPMDAAFKRRWAFEYLPLDSKENIVEDRIITFQKRRINWNHFRTNVNNKLKELSVAEDKLIGPFFMNKSELANDSSIKNKLLLYLRDDVVRHNADNLFKQRTFSDIISEYDKGNEIFNDIIFENATEKPQEQEEPTAE